MPRSLSFAVTTCFVHALLALSALGVAGCKDAEKAFDQAGTGPGEADGRAVQLSTTADRLTAVAADDTTIVILKENGDVVTRPKNATPADPQKIGSMGNPDDFEEGLGFDADFIYAVSGIGGLWRMPRAGGNGEKLDEANGMSVAIASDAVFYVSHDQTAIRRLDKKTKAATDWVTGYKLAIQLALDEKGDKVWVVDKDLETVSWVPTAQADAPPALTVIASNQAAPLSIGTGPDYVYWSNSQLTQNTAVENKLMRIKKDGTGQPEIVGSTDGTFVEWPMRSDDQFLYYGTGDVYRVPAAGGTGSRFLHCVQNGFTITSDSVIVVENHGNEAAASDRALPNRLLEATK